MVNYDLQPQSCKWGEEADNVYRVKKEPCMCELCMSGETCIHAKDKEDDKEGEARNETVAERGNNEFGTRLTGASDRIIGVPS